jgi:hypothetical protein
MKDILIKTIYFFCTEVAKEIGKRTAKEIVSLLNNSK